MMVDYEYLFYFFISWFHILIEKTDVSHFTNNISLELISTFKTVRGVATRKFLSRDKKIDSAG